jgi:hypothetical protein
MWNAQRQFFLLTMTAALALVAGGLQAEAIRFDTPPGNSLALADGHAAGIAPAPSGPHPTDQDPEPPEGESADDSAATPQGQETAPADTTSEQRKRLPGRKRRPRLSPNRSS